MTKRAKKAKAVAVPAEGLTQVRQVRQLHLDFLEETADKLQTVKRLRKEISDMELESVKAGSTIRTNRRAIIQRHADIRQVLGVGVRRG